MTHIDRETSPCGRQPVMVTWLLQTYLDYLPYVAYQNYNKDHAYNTYTGYNHDQVGTLTTSPQRPFQGYLGTPHFEQIGG